MDVYSAPAIYERIIHANEEKHEQIRMVVNTFRGIEYLHLRKYYMDFDGEWAPSVNGVAMPLTFDNSRELFSALVEILSLAESKDILEKEFKEQLDNIYLK
jgi:hypothetical protein